VIGGPASVSDAVKTALEHFGTTVTRLDNATYPDLSGYPNDRYGTDAAVAEQAFGGTATTVYLASGANFPDALGAGAAAGAAGGPVLLVTPTSTPAAIAHELSVLKPTTIYIVGGTASVSDAVLAAVAAYMGP
jgi:putative cell wall-binding protein